ncbi:ABC transporter ATP-binding protein [Streptomyces albus subsp. chlorinus]|uniref:ABC transporter ATP-binding protein n=1 Tax=Streptomyces albus TaxID=1888 RepID=UPI00156DC6C5|nr:ABC transporter ATP-binding protein [Streptomyces albus subsp. chlorinus]
MVNVNSAGARNGAAALVMAGVTRRHGRGGRAVQALRGVDVTLPRGSFTAVMGPSGSGKSTLLQCAVGLDRPTSGSVRLGGQELTRAGRRALTRLRRDRVGFVFQSFNLLPALTAEQNVRLPLRLAGGGARRSDRDRARRALARVGLADRAHSRPAELSGGQQQRVALARALVTAPELLCADEPTGALDPATAEDVLSLLRGSVDELGTTVLMVTHDPAAAAWADRVLFLADGLVVDEYVRAGGSPAAAAPDAAPGGTPGAAYDGTTDAAYDATTGAAHGKASGAGCDGASAVAHIAGRMRALSRGTSAPSGAPSDGARGEVAA